MAETTVKGYKVFNPDWTCRGKQYICPGSFEEDVRLRVCFEGMHFCKRAADCFNYYTFTPENHVAEVIAYGEIVEDGDKCCTNKLEIVREVPWAEVLEIVNTGRSCSGIWNSGNGNGGKRNSGSWNSGYRNSGGCNSGDWNSGDRNSGDRNSGDRNSGNCNSGNCNSGNCNSGNYNSGDRNSGDWNSGNFSNGCFNTVTPKIYLFNKSSKWTYLDWLNSEARALLNQIDYRLLDWICFESMSDKEKVAHPEAEITGGYLKKLDKSECAIVWWRGLGEEEKAIIKSIPNFDPAIFKEITGIDVEAE